MSIMQQVEEYELAYNKLLCEIEATDPTTDRDIFVCVWLQLQPYACPSMRMYVIKMHDMIVNCGYTFDEAIQYMRDTYDKTY